MTVSSTLKSCCPNQDGVAIETNWILDICETPKQRGQSPQPIRWSVYWFGSQTDEQKDASGHISGFLVLQPEIKGNNMEKDMTKR